MHQMIRGVSMLLLVLGLSQGAPILESQGFYNLGQRITVQVKATDGIDGRQEENKLTSTTGNDWVGLFRSGECNEPDNLQDRHKCYLASKVIPATLWEGEISFEIDEYQSAGEFDVRYFYGNNPHIEGNTTSPHFTWSGQGYVCNTAAGMQGSVFYLNKLDTAWVQYVASQVNWTTTDSSTVYSPDPGCGCKPWEGNFQEQRACCLRHQNCIPPMDEAIRVCRRYHDTYVADNQITISCGCDPNSGTVEQQAWCQETIAACQRCALDSVASTTVHVLGSMGIDDPQQSLKEIPGFEMLVS